MKPIAQHFFVNGKGIKTHIIRIGKSKEKLVFLHGWGGSVNESFFKLALGLHEKLPNTEIILLDLPGFGFSENPPKEGWETFQYADWLKKILEVITEKGDQLIFYGHSFGCRVIVRFLEKNLDFNAKVILTGAAGIKLPSTIREKIAKKLSKIAKPKKKLLPQKIQKFILQKIFKAYDWSKVNTALKPTLKKVLEETDFRESLKKINQETLLIWGENDKITKLEVGEIFQKNLKNSQLEILAEGRHGIHYTHQDKIIELVQKFIEKK